MRQRSISILLEEISENIVFIRSNYKNALNNDKLQGKLQAIVKSSLEHLRSCLDYVVHDIYEKIIMPYKTVDKDIHFPYGKTPQNFYSSLCSNLSKDLKTINNDIYFILESIQPYKIKNNWLIDLCKNTNFHKHNNLLDQRISNSVSIMDGNRKLVHIQNSNVTIDNCSFNGKAVNHLEVLDNGEIITDTNFDEIGLILINWSSFTFETNNIDILNLLSTSLENITELQSKIYLLLNKIA